MWLPHGILNWVISRMVWVKLWYWNFEQLIIIIQTMYKGKKKNKFNKRSLNWSAKERMQSVEMYTSVHFGTLLSVLHERPDTNVTHKHEVWNDSHFMCLLFQASKQTFYILNIDCCFENTGIYKVLHHNEIFRVNDAKARPRLNTGSVLYPHTVEKLTV